MNVNIIGKGRIPIINAIAPIHNVDIGFVECIYLLKTGRFQIVNNETGDLMTLNNLNRISKQYHAKPNKPAIVSAPVVNKVVEPVKVVEPAPVVEETTASVEELITTTETTTEEETITNVSEENEENTETETEDDSTDNTSNEYYNYKKKKKNHN